MGNYSFAKAHAAELTTGNKFYQVVEQTYLQLNPASNLPSSPKQLLNFMQSYDKGFVANTKAYIDQMQKSGNPWTAAELPVSLRLQPLLDIHTDTAFNGWGFTDYGKIDPKMVWILLIIAIGILVIACINFTTLAIGRSAGRSKEVGVRKVIGAERKQLVTQFLTESVLLAILSGLLGLAVTPILLPWFNNLSGTSFRLSLGSYPLLLVILGVVIFMVGLLAGSYPALVLSGFKPLSVLKNKVKVGGSNLFTRSLVAFQFVISIALIVSTFIIVGQTKFLASQNPGFNKENIVIIDGSQVDPKKVFPLFRQQVLGYPSVQGITSAAAGLGFGEQYLGYSDQGLSASGNLIDPNYMDVMGMRMVVGQPLTNTDFKNPVRPIIINETMMRSLGWNTGNVIGKELKNFQGGSAIIAGVVKDFHYASLSEPVKNQFFETSSDQGYGHIYARIRSGNPTAALADLQKAWTAAAPGIPMNYNFLDERLNAYYQNEQRWSQIAAIAGGICIFLACLGLLGLVTLAAINRTKEIGVRKVLGASTGHIIYLLAEDFIKLIVIAFFIASPMAWYWMNLWLNAYATRINMTVWTFLIVGAGTVVTALITISFQSLNAARRNPVKSLRTE